MITSIEIKNYKSLRDVTIPLQPLTVLVGPNAAGKSNILDCLAFVADIVREGLRGALGRRGGFSDVVWGGQDEDQVSLTIAFEGHPRPGEREVPESFRIVVDATGIVEEEARIHTAEGQSLSYNRKKDGRLRREDQGRIGAVELDTSMLGVSPLAVVREDLRDWCFHDFSHREMRSPQPVRREIRINSDGNNAATILHWIYSEERDVFDRVEEDIKVGIPEVDELLSRLTRDGRTYLGWKEKDVPGPIHAWNMSEGSVRLVGVLLALRVPSPPRLATFETPEIHLHPYLMEYLADILRAGSERSQVIATTHSAALLNCLLPDNVLIVSKERGVTRVKQVEDSRQLREALKRLGLGELWHAGHLGGVP